MTDQVGEQTESSMFMKPELGRIARYVEVPELIIRSVPAYGVLPEFDGTTDDDETETLNGPRYEDRLQGRLVNTTTHKLSDIKYDLSYYDGSGVFLGLTNSRFLDEDELDTNDYLPIDMKVELPDGTTRCVFNVRAKKPGIIGRMFWG